MSLEQKIQQQYARMAASYDRRWHSYLRQSLPLIQAWLEFNPMDQVLELGCGTGELALQVLKTYPELTLTGLDLSPQMLAIAQQKCSLFPQAQFLQASASQLPFPDAYFDWIISSSVFHYFSDPGQVLAEAKRVLKPRGQVVILDWVLPLLDPTYRTCYTLQEFEILLKQAGFFVQTIARHRPSWAWEFMIAHVRQESYPI